MVLPFQGQKQRWKAHHDRRPAKYRQKKDLNRLIESPDQAKDGQFARRINRTEQVSRGCEKSFVGRRVAVTGKHEVPLRLSSASDGAEFGNLCFARAAFVILLFDAPDRVLGVVELRQKMARIGTLAELSDRTILPQFSARRHFCGQTISVRFLARSPVAKIYNTTSQIMKNIDNQNHCCEPRYVEARED
jgi:hypothetical protein